MNGSCDCLLLAGGTPTPGHSLYRETLGRPKALLEVAGQPMVQWVLDALEASDRIRRVVLVGLPEDVDVAYSKGLDLVPADGSWSDNFYAGVERLSDKPGESAAYCWSDIPLARGAMFDRFLDAVGERPMQVHAGLVSRTRLEQRFGPLREPWLRLRDGDFVAADFGLFQPSEAARVRTELEALAPQRKSALRQAHSVGWGLLIRYLLRRLGIDDFERRLAGKYRISCRIHIVEDPELGLDVDQAENLAICRRILTQTSM